MSGPHDFSDAAVPFGLLRQRAFNRRWAEQPEGVIPLTAADPDFRTAPAIRERLARYAHEGVMGYGPPHGLPEFREAVAGWMRTTRHFACDAGAVLATDGAASAMALVARASLRPGDEALVPDPVDFLFQHAVQRAGATAIPVPLSPATTADAFIAAMRARLTPRTRMLWLCNPNNPLGVVHARAWLDPVVHWAVERRLRVLSDEVWSDIVFEPNRHVSPASLSPEAAAQVATVYGFSKNFALAGLRVGCVVCTDPAWFRRIAEASDAQSTVSGAATLSQVAATAALQEGRPWLADFVRHLQGQRDHAVARLKRWPGVQVHAPQGTYVAFPDVSRLTADTECWCADMKAQAGVALVPGAPRWFGQGAAGHVRLCFATSRQILDTAFDRMDAWVAAQPDARPRPTHPETKGSIEWKT
jgi:cystathionine beta-lyase